MHKSYCSNILQQTVLLPTVHVKHQLQVLVYLRINIALNGENPTAL